MKMTERIISSVGRAKNQYNILRQTRSEASTVGRWAEQGQGRSSTVQIGHSLYIFILFYFIFIVLLFICAYKAWVISPPCPYPLPYHPLRPLPLPRLILLELTFSLVLGPLLLLASVALKYLLYFSALRATNAS
jgi:hypothetical protein